MGIILLLLWNSMNWIFTRLIYSNSSKDPMNFRTEGIIWQFFRNYLITEKLHHNAQQESGTWWWGHCFYYPLSDNLKKWSNTPKNSSAIRTCLSVFDHFVNLTLIGLINVHTSSNKTKHLCCLYHYESCRSTYYFWKMKHYHRVKYIQMDNVDTIISQMLQTSKDFSWFNKQTPPRYRQNRKKNAFKLFHVIFSTKNYWKISKKLLELKKNFMSIVVTKNPIKTKLLQRCLTRNLPSSFSLYSINPVLSIN